MDIFNKNLKKIPVASDVQQTMDNWKKVLGKPQIVKACDNIHVATGYGMGNVIFIDTMEGLVIVDTSDGCNVTRKIKEDAGELMNKPVRKIIYTHNHGDHRSGTAEFLSPGTEIIAQKEFMKVHQYNNRLRQKVIREAVLQYCLDLPPEERHIKLNLDALEEKKEVLPTTLFDYFFMFTLGGLDFKLYHLESETEDHLVVWIPQLAAACTGDLYYPSFPAISSPVKRVRSAYKWCKSLEFVLSLEPVYLIPSHSQPIAGRKEVVAILTDYRDAVKHVDDEVVKGLNQGKTLEELRNTVKLPARLRDKPHLRELYGKVSWAVEGVFRSYSGWFEGNPVWLDPLPSRERNAEFISLAGGVENILQRAVEHQQANNHQLALELCDTVLSVDPGNRAALELKVFSLQFIGLNTFNTNSRGFYLGEAVRISRKLEY